MRRAARPGPGPVARFLLAFMAGLAMAACVPADPDDPQVAFWTAVRALCGQAFEGTLVEGSAADRAALTGQLVLEVWQCYADELRLAFHAGDDHSRVWLLSPSTDGLALRHEVHGADGEAASFSGYGGATPTPGTPTAQTFVPDEQTLADVPTAAGTRWVFEIVPGEKISYRLISPVTDDFRVDFDLQRPAGRQPAPWGFTRRR